MAVVPEDGASGADFGSLDGHFAIVFESIHGFLGGVEVAEEEPEEPRCDDGRDGYTS